MLTRLAFIICFALLPTTLFAAGGDKNAPVQVSVTLSPLGSFVLSSPRIFGKGKRKGDMYIAKELRVPIQMMKTGIGLRDKHTKEKLGFPKIKNILATNVKAKGNKGRAELTINNIKKPVMFTFKDLGNNTAEASFKLSLKDFGIEGINYQGVGVQDEVTVKAIVGYDMVGASPAKPAQ